MSFVIKNGRDKFLALFGGVWDWLSKTWAYKFHERSEAEKIATRLRASLEKPEEISVQEI